MELFDFKKKINKISDIIIHTDVLRGFITKKVNTKNDFFNFHKEKLESLCSDSNLFFPAFNYDFCNTGIFNVRRDPIQIGMLNEHLRNSTYSYRSSTPVFSFISKKPFSLKHNLKDLIEIDPFDTNSFFGQAYRSDFGLIHYGSKINSTTLIHFAERTSGNIVYRYDKFFNGVVVNGNNQIEVTLKYHVRPLDLDLKYDWDKIKSDLISNNLYFEHKKGKTLISFIQVRKVIDFWLYKLSKNSLYFLDTDSLINVEKILQKNGEAFKIEDFE